jgi:hypothetical protein
MPNPTRIILLLCCCCMATTAAAQIVNMESQRMQTDTTGWSGNANGSIAISSYGQKVFAVNAGAHLQYQSKKNLYLLLGNYGFLKGNEQSFIDYGFLHFRYNRKLGKVVRLEAFSQIQQNLITKIESRFLTGAGPRFKIASRKKIRLYAASLVMYEIEKEKGRPGKIYDWRSSSYVSATWVINEQTSFITTTYYQPVFFNIGDYRLLNQSSFKIKASKKIAITLNYNYQFDASPAAGVVRDTYNLSTGIEVNF